MTINRYRIRNRILQKLYRPRRGQGRFFTSQILASIDEIERRIEEEITPLLSELF